MPQLTLLDRIGLAALMSHHVPAWALVVVVALFLIVESMRLVYGHRASVAYERALDHAETQQAALMSALETLGRAIDRGSHDAPHDA